jgi:SH3-like domain-containing protein
MMIGKNVAAALAPAAMGLALLCQPGAATADEVTVKKNGTPLTLAPTRDAPIEWKVNSGFPLVVVEERGGWVRVQSDRLPNEGQELWVRANQVAALDNGQSASSAATGAIEKPIGYRIELTGTPGLKFKLECRTVRDGRFSFRPHYNRLPQTYEYPGDPIACVVWKKQRYGVLEIGLVEIYPSEERIIGHAATEDYPASIFARSRGPDYATSIFPRSRSSWGPAAVVPATDNNFVLPPSASAGP